MTTSHEGWVVRLRKALQDGEPLDLSGMKGARVWPDDPAGRKWPKGATIPARAIREVLVRPGVEVDPRGLKIVGARVTGEIDLNNVAVGFAFGLVDCRLDEPFNARHSRWHDLRIAHSHVPGLNLDRARIDGNLSLPSLAAVGEVRALGATITGQLGLEGAHLTNKDGDALSLDGATIGGGAFLDYGFTAEGEVRALGATITGQLNLKGAHLTNKDGNALNLDRASIGGSALLNDGFTAEGEVRALGATITGQLNLKRAHLTNKDGNALNLDGARIGSLFVAGSVVAGVTDLTDSHIECVVTGPKEHTLPTPVAVDGLRVDDIHGFLRSNGKSIRKWLGARPDYVPFSPGPWVRMADVYRTNGHPEIARRLRYEAARRITKTSPWWSKTLRRMYQVTVGFGHYPWITGFWLAGVLASSALLAHVTGDSFTKVNATAPGTFSALSIAIETAIPAAGTLGATDWVSTTHWVAWTLAGLRVIAWVMTALMLAGVTGLLKKAD